MSDFELVKQILARYVRAADRRDGPSMASLFLAEGEVIVSHNNGGKREPLGHLSGHEAISVAVSAMMRPHPERGWSHHTTHDHIIEIDGDRASIDAQFIVFNTLGLARPEAGWPEGTTGAQGSVTPIEAGYYRSTLRRIDGRWFIERHEINLDLPMAVPGEA
jgi:hypothetical protein